MRALLLLVITSLALPSCGLFVTPANAGRRSNHIELFPHERADGATENDSETTHCQSCEATLDGKLTAHACDHGCTFCEACAADLNATCPNCSGALRSR